MPMDYGEKKKIVDKLGSHDSGDDDDDESTGHAHAGEALAKALKSGDGKAIYRAMADLYAMMG